MLSKSQVSAEYMLVMGFATLMTIPLLLIYYSYSSNTSDSVATAQAMQIARKVVDASEQVYFLGKPSQTTLKINFPDRIASTNLTNREVVLKIKTAAGIAEVVQISSVNISGSLPITPGIHVITVKADDGFVQISSN
ncbi:hypothetical protein HYS31_01075 [Candidatus Woesearchaeota archaeon]|nr:hypothetical protein [Candidatus Woesearchaeota archaeon]